MAAVFQKPSFGSLAITEGHLFLSCLDKVSSFPASNHPTRSLDLPLVLSCLRYYSLLCFIKMMGKVIVGAW